nr:hypothetical protein GCM10020092_072110 [Actinoplanes digitatis]
MDEFDADVIVVGAGPSGLMLAGELQLAGLSAIVVDRLAEPITQSRALGFSARTIEEFGQRGLLPQFGEFETIPVGHFGGLPIDYRIIDGGNFGVRGVPQSLTERILAGWAGGLGADIRRGHDLVGLAADERGVTAELTSPAGGTKLRAAYLVGCDGARSTVRRLTGIDFPGNDATIEMKMADVAGLGLRIRPTGEVGEAGMVVVLPLGPAATRVVVFERDAGVRKTQEAPTFTEVADAFQRVTGEDIHTGTPVWTSYFTDASLAGERVPPRPGVPRRRRRAHPPADRRAGHQRRRRRRREPRVEAGRHRQGLGTRRAARHLPRRTAPGRRADRGEHAGPALPLPRRPRDAAAARPLRRAGRHRGGAAAPRRDGHRPGHPVRRRS